MDPTSQPYSVPDKVKPRLYWDVQATIQHSLSHGVCVCCTTSLPSHVTQIYRWENLTVACIDLWWVAYEPDLSYLHIFNMIKIVLGGCVTCMCVSVMHVWT